MKVRDLVKYLQELNQDYEISEFNSDGKTFNMLTFKGTAHGKAFISVGLTDNGEFDYSAAVPTEPNPFVLRRRSPEDQAAYYMEKIVKLEAKVRRLEKQLLDDKHK